MLCGARLAIIIEMSENCCLCQRELTDSTSRKRRKKLYGKSAEKSREVLEALTEEKLHVSLAGIVETSSHNFYLCHSSTLGQYVMRFMPFAVPLALNSHLSPTLLPGELRTKRLTTVVQTVTASVTVWLRETSE